MRVIIFILISLLLYSSISIAQINSYKYERDCESQMEYLGCIYVESLPELAISMDSLLSGLKYPNNALKNKIEGTVYVKLLIDTTGLPVCGVIIKGFDDECNSEALRLAMTANYIPAMIRKHKALVPIVLPVKFEIRRFLKSETK